ncbi:MAG TPA: carboxypeptidase-like regulatory domain-containing protein [Gaiellaceae bacterium]|nr:carboxypeptidase-like regulatory domain-containing protein [Gaiellaceae bacterium]
MLTKRGIVVGAVLVGAAVATVVAASATTPGSAAQRAVARGFAQQRSTAGPGKTTRSSLHARTAMRGHLPRAVVRSRPRELHLRAAGSRVFDVRMLKGTVARKERPERTPPGFAPEGTNAAEALESPARVAPQLPQVMTQSQLASAQAPGTDSSFDGLDFANWGAGHPPDTNGDVGPTYYIETVNTSIGIYDKSSGNRVAAFTFDAFMSQGHFGNLCDTDNFGDPVVLYDTYENRWVISDFAFKLDGSGNVSPQTVFECFAVSKTGDPVDGGWNYYSILAPGGLADYPKLGIWPDGIYMSANMFGYSSSGSYFGYHVWALNKLQMYAGDPSPQVVDFAGDTSDFTVIPANSRLQTGAPPAGSPEYFVSTEQYLNALSIYKFHVDWDKVSTSTFTGPDVQAAPNCWPNAAPSNASTPANPADVLAIRAMAQAQYSNLGGTESLWVDHTVNRGTFATSSCGGANTNNATVRWYQGNVTGGTVAANVSQGATYDPEGANTFFRFMPALAVDRAGDLAITYTKSNSTTNPQIKYAGRLAGDPANTLGQGEQTLVDGTGAQSGNCGGSACVRWGDYSGMALDPNGCEFWMAGEYYATTGLNDLTRIGSFHYPGCTTVGNGTLSGNVTDGTGPVAGATVTLGSRTTTSDGSGNYSFTVPAGTYPTLTASKAGFTSGSVATITVPDGGTATRNFTLGAAAQSGCFTDDTQSAFQRGVPSTCDLVSSPGSVVLAAPDNTDARNANVGANGFGFTNTSWAGQTFTPTVTGQLKRVDVELFCSACTATSPNVTLSIRNTTGATPVPTGADLATATLPGFNDGGAGGLKTFTFPSPITLTAGTRYALVFRLASSFASGTVAYTCSCTPDSSPYASGQRVTSANSGSTWTADSTAGGRDLNFVTYINPGFASSGTFTSSLKDANPAAGRTPTWTTLSFTATQPAGTSVKFQLAASNSSAGPFTFVGPDGTAGTFFTTSGASLSRFDGFRYLKYRAYLTTSSGGVTPTLASVGVCFADTAGTAATSLAVSAASGTYGGTASLSATLTSGGNGVGGETVAFSLNGSSVGSAVTNGSGVATLANASLAGIGAGAYATGVGASFPGDSSYAASSGSASLTVSKADQAIAVTTHAPASAVYGTGFGVAATGGASGNAVTFSSSGACANTGASFTMTSGTGTCSVSYDQAGSANYNPAPQLTESVTALKADQTITVTQHAPSAAPLGSQFTVAASAPGGTVAYSSAGSCSNTGATFTITSSGTCSVEYDQSGSADYNAAPQVLESVTAGKQAQSITITLHAPASAVYGAGFSVAATGGGSGNPVTFSSSGACSNTGSTFTMTGGTGTCTVKYDQAGDDQYADAPELTEKVTAQKADQTITVTTHAPSSAVFGTGFSVAATAPGGAVSFSSSGACSNTAAAFTITSGTGTCTVKYDRGGDSNYNAAPQVTETVTAQKANQTIVITLHAPTAAAYGSGFSVAADAPGGAVTYASSGSCTSSGDTFTITSGTGTCTAKYDQAGDANYNAAPELSEITTAQKAGQTISFAPLPDRAVGDPDFTVGATASSGLTVSLAASGQCTVSGTTVHLTGAGSCTITASQGGDSNYAAAPDVPRTFQISAASSSQITDTLATCSQFAAGTAPTLGTVWYTVKNGAINKETPSKLEYWVKLDLTAGAQHVEVDQAITSGNFTRTLGLAAGSAVFAPGCAAVKKPTIAAGPGGSVTADFTAARAGTYYLGVRYLASSVNGQAQPSPTTVHYEFSTAGRSGSTSGVDLKKQLAATPALAVRSTFLRALKH